MIGATHVRVGTALFGERGDATWLKPSLSSVQRMLQRRTSPELFAAMQRAIARCGRCECPTLRRASASIWDMGGMRYKALGEPKKRLRCPRLRQEPAGCGSTGPAATRPRSARGLSGAVVLKMHPHHDCSARCS